MKKLLLASFLITAVMSYAQDDIEDVGPGYQFGIFKKTAIWNLAIAVQNEDTIKMAEILRDSNININLQEPEFKMTLLHLAVANDKVKSVKYLLAKGAKLNILNADGRDEIHDATFVTFRGKKTYEITKLLIAYGANVNSCRIENGDTLSSPLIYAIDDFNTAKLLLDNGADLYLKSRNNYLVWMQMLTQYDGDGIYFAKYVIIDKHMAVPNPIGYSMPDRKPLDIYFYLGLLKFKRDIKKETVRKEILDYLHKANP